MIQDFERGDLVHIPSETKLFKKLTGFDYYTDLVTFEKPIIGHYIGEYKNDSKVFHAGSVYYVAKLDIYKLRF
jgi:hypothetical protein